MKESFPITPANSTEQKTPFEVIDGLWSEGFDTPRLIKTKSGRLVLATDVGLREKNEDALFLNTEKDAFAVIDGMGGYPHGDLAARMVAEAIQEGVHEGVPPKEMQRRAHEKMKESGIREGAHVMLLAKL